MSPVSWDAHDCCCGLWGLLKSLQGTQCKGSIPGLPRIVVAAAAAAAVAVHDGLQCCQTCVNCSCIRGHLHPVSQGQHAKATTQCWYLWPTTNVIPCFVTAHPDATTKGNRRNIKASWNPFSTGPRNCIGQTLALAELRTVLAVMIGNFFFELPEGVQREKFIDEEEVWWVTLQAKHGLPLKVTPITPVQA